MMEEEKSKKPDLTERDKGFIRMRSIMDYGMGILWASMGVFFIYIREFNTGIEARFDNSTMKALGGICILYGGFRIYRGIRKNYLKEK